MKKYRIITNGHIYKVQFRWWGIWRHETETIYDKDGELRRLVEFLTYEEAKKWIKSRFGTGWRVVD